MTELANFFARDVACYITERERAAYRAGMSTAAAICDALAKEVKTSNTSRRGITKTGASLALIAEICGDRISEFREKISIKAKT